MDRLRRLGLLAHAKTSGFHRKLSGARGIIGLSLDSNPYVAFSGGKDSLAALALAARARPGITAIWSDDELEYPEQESYVPQVCAELGANLIMITGGTIHDGWFRPWTDEPFWRQVPAATIRTKILTQEFAAGLGHRGVILGLRQQESSLRRMYLRSYGSLWTDKKGIERVHPLSGWTVKDVWALILSWEIRYNPVYDRLSALGLSLTEQRVGPLPLTNGAVLRAGWPDMYSRLISRYGARWHA